MFLPNITANATKIVHLSISVNDFPDGDNDIPLWAANGWSIWLIRVGIAVGLVLALRLLYITLRNTKFEGLCNYALVFLGIVCGNTTDATFPNLSGSEASVVQAGSQAIALAANRVNAPSSDSRDNGNAEHRHQVNAPPARSHTF